MKTLFIQIDNTPTPIEAENNYISLDCRQINNFCSFVGDALVGNLKDHSGFPIYRLINSMGYLISSFETVDKTNYDKIIAQWWNILGEILHKGGSKCNKQFIIYFPQQYTDWLINNENEYYEIIGENLQANQNKVCLDTNGISEDIIYALRIKINRFLNEKKDEIEFITFSNGRIDRCSDIVKSLLGINPFLKAYVYPTNPFYDFLQLEFISLVANKMLLPFDSHRSSRMELRGGNISIYAVGLKVKKDSLKTITLTINDKYADFSYTELINLQNYKLGEIFGLYIPYHKMSEGLHFVEIKTDIYTFVNYIFDVSKDRILIEEIRPNTKDLNLNDNNYKGVLWDIIYSTNRACIIGNYEHSSACVGHYELDNLLSIICGEPISNEELSYKDMNSYLQTKGFELVSPPHYRNGIRKVFNAVFQKIDAPLVYTIVIENASDYSIQSMDKALNTKGNNVQVAVGLYELYPNYLIDEFEPGVLPFSILNHDASTSISDKSVSSSISSNESSYTDDLPFYATEPYTG